MALKQSRVLTSPAWLVGSKTGPFKTFEVQFLTIVILLYCIFFAVIAAGRTYINYNETDFIYFTVPEAKRILAGEPLLSLYHPPFYVLTITAAKQLLGDWLRAGLSVSFVCGVVSLLTSYILFRRLAGTPAAVGAVIALIGSAVFMGEAARSATDMLFLTLFLLSCLFAVLALKQKTSVGYWLICGVSIGLALMTRTNALPLVLLAFAPFLSNAHSMKAHAGRCLLVIGGIAAPILVMFVFLKATGSSIFPANTHVNLAMTYFSTGRDRGSVEDAIMVADRFSGSFEVLFFDPLRTIGIYLFDLYQLISYHVLKLVERPLLLMSLPGIFILLAKHGSRSMFLIVGLFIIETLLINFKSFDARYYMYLIPLIGAGIGQITWFIVTADISRTARTIVFSVIAGMCLAAMTTASIATYKRASSQEIEITEVVPLLANLSASDTALVARKPHLSYHSGMHGLYFPDFDTLEDLSAYLSAPNLDLPDAVSGFLDVTTDADTIYLFYGQTEADLRPQFSALSDPKAAPDWLKPVLSSQKPGEWVLYRYEKAGDKPAE